MTPRITAALAASLLIALAPGLAAADAAETSAPAKLAVPAVSTVAAQKRELVDRLTVSGTLVARDEILVAAQIEGLRIVELLADEGDTVKAGQVLARLARDTIEAQIAQSDAAISKAEAGIAQARSQITQAEATAVEARAGLARAQALKQSGNVSQEVLDQRIALALAAEGRLAAAKDGLNLAQADKAQAEASRRELGIRLERTEIRTPVGGIVSRRTARLGANTALGGDALFRIVANGEVELEAEILEMHLARVPPGAPVTVTTAAGKTVTGKVRLLPAEVDRATRLGRVRISLPPGDRDLRVGAFARAEVEIARHNGIAVPNSAVVFAPDGATVQVVRDGRIQVVPVKTGIAAQGQIEILSGLTEGDAVVARAAGFLRQGDAVRAMPEGEKSAAMETK
jgi:RND family efflux transporter MFP subunit